ncbi:MAG: DMT family transporter [Victivallaceae bacterium]|nr:DMT family transporter [Victivallaceae bacterium]
MFDYLGFLSSLGRRRKLLVGFLAAVICEGVYGFSFYFTKTALDTVSTIDLLAWRFTVAFLLLLGLWKGGIANVRIPRENRLPVLLLGLFYPCGYFICETAGLQRTTTSEAAMMLAGVPVVAILLSSVLSRKLPAAAQVAGVVISLAGMAVCILENGWAMSFNGTGRRLILGAVVMSSLYLVFAQTQHVTPASKTFLPLFIGALCFDSIALVAHLLHGDVAELLLLPFRNPVLIGPILYLGAACSVVAMAASNVAVDMIGAGAFTSFSGVETIVTLCAGRFLLGEKLSAAQLLGAALILAGVAIANRIGKTLFSLRS